MNSAVLEVMSRLKSGDTDTRSNAVTDLALLLEMHSWELDYEQRISRYETLLSGNLIGVNLNKQEQEEVIDFMKALVLNQDSLSSSLIWAIGKSTPSVGLGSTLEIIDHRFHRFSDEELYQLIIALGNFLCTDDTDLSGGQNRQAIFLSNLVPFLAEVVSINSNEQDSSRRLKEAAQGLLDVISEL